MTSIALAIPHTPWIPERVKSLRALMNGLGLITDADTPWASDDEGPQHFRDFTDREPNTVWSLKLWQWLYDTGADWCLQLQDDVMVAPCFWPALRAMIAALPEDAHVLGLTSTHPMAYEIARRGHRWYRTPSNVVGWAYAMSRTAMGRFLEFRSMAPEAFRQINEDEQIAHWCRETKTAVWHPVPAICDHDTTIPSSYKNDNHSHRRPQCTWRDYGAESMSDPTWWKPSGIPEMLDTPPQRLCWFCMSSPPMFGSASGCQLCGPCVLKCVAHSMKVQVRE